MIDRNNRLIGLSDHACMASSSGTSCQRCKRRARRGVTELIQPSRQTGRRSTFAGCCTCRLPRGRSGRRQRAARQARAARQTFRWAQSRPCLSEATYIVARDRELALGGMTVRGSSAQCGVDDQARLDGTVETTPSAPSRQPRPHRLSWSLPPRRRWTSAGKRVHSST